MRKFKSQSKTLSERVVPEWYYWVGVVISGIVVLITCIKWMPDFGFSVWVANLAVLGTCAIVVGSVTYFRSNFAAAITFGASIIGGSLVLAGLSNIIPVIEVTYGSLWAGTPLGLLIGLTMTAGERR